MHLRQLCTAGAVLVVATAGIGTSAIPASADEPTSTVSLAGVPASIVLPARDHSGSASYPISVTDPVAGMSYRVEDATLTQAPYAPAIQPYSGISTTGTMTLSWQYAIAGLRGQAADVGGVQTLSVSVIGWIPDTDTEVTLPTATMQVRLIARDTAAQSIASSGFVKPGRAMTVTAETSVNAIGAAASLWSQRSGHTRWQRIATSVVKKRVLSGDIFPVITFHTTKAAVGRVRVVIAATARARASTSATARVTARGGLIGILEGED